MGRSLESARYPHLQPQLCGRGLVLWVWWVVWRVSPAGELPGDALLLPPEVPRGLGGYCWQQSPRSPPDGTDMGLNFLLEPSVLGEALLTLPATTFPCAVRLARPSCARSRPLFLSSTDIHCLQEAALQSNWRKHRSCGSRRDPDLAGLGSWRRGCCTEMSRWTEWP